MFLDVTFGCHKLSPLKSGEHTGISGTWWIGSPSFLPMPSSSPGFLNASGKMLSQLLWRRQQVVKSSPFFFCIPYFGARITGACTRIAAVPPALKAPNVARSRTCGSDPLEKRDLNTKVGSQTKFRTALKTMRLFGTGSKPLTPPCD